MILTRRDLLDLGYHRLDSFVDVMGFPGNLLAARQNRFRLAQSNRHRPAVVALNDAVYEVPLHGCIFIEGRVAFGFANLLDDHLLGALGRDSAQQGRVNGFFPFLRLHLARAAVDRDRDALDFTVVLFGRKLQCGLDPLEDHIFGDVLLTVHDIDQSQHFGCS